MTSLSSCSRQSAPHTLPLQIHPRRIFASRHCAPSPEICGDLVAVRSGCVHKHLVRCHTPLQPGHCQYRAMAQAAVCKLLQMHRQTHNGKTDDIGSLQHTGQHFHRCTSQASGKWHLHAYMCSIIGGTFSRLYFEPKP